MKLDTISAEPPAPLVEDHGVDNQSPPFDPLRGELAAAIKERAEPRRLRLPVRPSSGFKPSLIKMRRGSPAGTTSATPGPAKRVCSSPKKRGRGKPSFRRFCGGGRGRGRAKGGRG